MKFRLGTPLRRVIVVLKNHFDLTYFSELCKLAQGKTSRFSIFFNNNAKIDFKFDEYVT